MGASFVEIPKVKSLRQSRAYDLYARCPLCGYYLSLERDAQDRCPCGNLSKQKGDTEPKTRLGMAAVKLFNRSVS